MTRLIDAEALKKLFPDNGEGSWTYNITARSYIDNAPTVEAYTRADYEGAYTRGYWDNQAKPCKRCNYANYCKAVNGKEV